MEGVKSLTHPQLSHPFSHPLLNALANPRWFAQHVKTGNPHHQVALPSQRLIANPIALLACLGEMVRAVDFQNEFQFHAAEVGRVGREGIFAAKLLAADLPVANPLPDGLREFIGRGALALARTRWLPGLGRGCVS